MTLKIGPMEFDCGPIGDSILWTNGVATFAIETAAMTVSAAAVIQHQVDGLTDTQNPVAVTWGDDPTRWDGMYTVSGSVAPIGNYLGAGNGRQRVSLALTRVSNLIEAAYTLTYRTTVPTNYYITAVHGYYAATDAVTYMSENGGFNLTETINVADLDGDPALMYAGGKVSAALTTTAVQQSVNPALYDIGGCVIQAAEAGTTAWWTVTSDHSIPDNHDVRVSNGLIRITVVEGEIYVLVETWTGTLWSDAARVSFTANAYATGFVRRSRPFRNDHASVTLRAPLDRAGFSPMLVDLTLVRGSAIATVNVSLGLTTATASMVATLAEHDGTNMATTANPDAVVRSTANTDGVRAGVYGDPAATITAATDTVTYSAVTSALFAVGAWTAEYNDVFNTNHGIADRLVR